MQLKPSPMVNGDLHVQVKFSPNVPSFRQSALGSQGPGSERQGSGTAGRTLRGGGKEYIGL